MSHSTDGARFTEKRGDTFRPTNRPALVAKKLWSGTPAVWKSCPPPQPAWIPSENKRDEHGREPRRIRSRAPYTPTYERSKAVELCTRPGQREVLKPKMASAPSENAGVSLREPSSPTVGRILPKKL